jgi:uncharacterized protein
MLKQSFCCFRGISEGAERKIWNSGCLNWRGLLFCRRAVSPARLAKTLAQLPEMQAALDGGIADYFLSRLPPGHRLRTWPDFHKQTLFLDIETTGMERYDEITVIGAYRAGCFMQYVRGDNLHDFLSEAGQAKLLVSFNGIRFDWPAIQRQFDVSLSLPHIDLMHEARSHGYAGGLKAIERRIGFCRTSEETGDGCMAVQLWRQYSNNGNRTALARLLHYNRSDVAALIVLSKHLLRLSLAGYPGFLPEMLSEKIVL